MAEIELRSLNTRSVSFGGDAANSFLYKNNGVQYPRIPFLWTDTTNFNNANAISNENNTSIKMLWLSYNGSFIETTTVCPSMLEYSIPKFNYQNKAIRASGFGKDVLHKPDEAYYYYKPNQNLIQYKDGINNKANQFYFNKTPVVLFSQYDIMPDTLGHQASNYMYSSYNINNNTIRINYDLYDGSSEGYVDVDFTDRILIRFKSQSPSSDRFYRHFNESYMVGSRTVTDSNIFEINTLDTYDSVAFGHLNPQTIGEYMNLNWQCDYTVEIIEIYNNGSWTPLESVNNTLYQVIKNYTTQQSWYRMYPVQWVNGNLKGNGSGISFIGLEWPTSYSGDHYTSTYEWKYSLSVNFPSFLGNTWRPNLNYTSLTLNNLVLNISTIASYITESLQNTTKYYNIAYNQTLVINDMIANCWIPQRLYTVGRGMPLEVQWGGVSKFRSVVGIESTEDNPFYKNPVTSGTRLDSAWQSNGVLSVKMATNGGDYITTVNGSSFYIESDNPATKTWEGIIMI